MSEGFGYLVVRRGIDNFVPMTAGDEVATYELAEPYPYLGLPPHSGHTRELLDYQDAVLQHANGADDWRVQRRLTCDCTAGRVIAQVLVHNATARLWVTAKPERIPVEYRREAARVEGWTLHGLPGQAPHVGDVASCNGCKKRWLIVSTADDAHAIAIKSATHGARIAP